eukprot:g437.t2
MKSDFLYNIKIIEQRDEELEELENKAQRTKCLLEDTTKALSELQNKNNALEERVKELENKEFVLMKQLEDKREDRTMSITNERNKMREFVFEMHEAVKEAHEKFSNDMKQRIAKEKQEREKWNQQLKEANDVISRHKAQASQNENILTQKEIKIKEQHDEILRLNDQLEGAVLTMKEDEIRHSQECNELNQQFEESALRTKELENEVSGLSKSLEEFKAYEHQQSDVVSSLQKTETRHREELNRIQSLLSSEKDKNLQLEHELLESRDLIGSLQSENEELEKMIAKLRQRKGDTLRKYEAKIKSTLEENDSIRKEIIKLQQELKEKEKQNEILRAEGKKEQRRRRSLEKHFEQKKTQECHRKQKRSELNHMLELLQNEDPSAKSSRSSRSHLRKNVLDSPQFRLNVYAPSQLESKTSNFSKADDNHGVLMTKSDVLLLEQQLSKGEGIRSLVNFNNALRSLTTSNWESKLNEVFREWCFNLESFNPAFAAVLLQVQSSVGESDYDRRDACLKKLIQPLAGEYGMHNNQPQTQTHRQLFKDFYYSLFPDSSLSSLLDPPPIHAKTLFQKMIHDIQSHGMNSIERACYALGYNLAIEYLADYEKRWMLHSFKHLASDTIHRDIDWVFLKIHAEDEKEHAEIGHEAVLSFAPKIYKDLIEQAMRDHDRDFAIFYNQLTALLE